MRLTLRILDPEEAPSYQEPVLVCALRNEDGTVSLKPCILEYTNEIGDRVPVEFDNEMVPDETENSRTMSAEVQIPVYRPDTGGEG